MPAGAPGFYSPEFAKQAAELTELGATIYELADAFGVCRRTINLWMNRHPEFRKAVVDARDIADQRVQGSLYEKALGYSFESEKIFCVDGQIVRAATIEHVPPSDTACIFWLKNRRRKEWADRTQTELSGPDGTPIQTEEVGAREILTRRIDSLAARLGTDSGDTESK